MFTVNKCYQQNFKMSQIMQEKYIVLKGQEMQEKHFSGCGGGELHVISDNLLVS